MDQYLPLVHKELWEPFLHRGGTQPRNTVQFLGPAPNDMTDFKDPPWKAPSPWGVHKVWDRGLVGIGVLGREKGLR